MSNEPLPLISLPLYFTTTFRIAAVAFTLSRRWKSRCPSGLVCVWEHLVTVNMLAIERGEHCSCRIVSLLAHTCLQGSACPQLFFRLLRIQQEEVLRHQVRRQWSSLSRRCKRAKTSASSVFAKSRVPIQLFKGRSCTSSGLRVTCAGVVTGTASEAGLTWGLRLAHLL